MFKKTTDQKTKSQATAKEPVILKDADLDCVAGGGGRIDISNLTVDRMGLMHTGSGGTGGHFINEEPG